MKRRDLISQLEKSGCYLIRQGGKHDIYHNPNNGKTLIRFVPHYVSFR